MRQVRYHSLAQVRPKASADTSLDVVLGLQHGLPECNFEVVCVKVSISLLYQLVPGPMLKKEALD